MRKTSPVLAAALLSSIVVGQCIPNPGTAITVAQDSITGPNAIGFAFPFVGSTYTDIHISDHGICYLTNGGVPATPTATPLVYTPVASSLVANGPVICPIWGDSIPGAAGTFYIDATATVCTITWVDVQSFGITPIVPFTFQLILNISGTIEFVYGPTVTNNSTFGGASDNGVVGVSTGTPSVLPSPVDFRSNPTSASSTIFEQYLSANTFDMAGDRLLLIPAGTGWAAVHTPNGAGCARATPYGTGCDGLSLSSNVPVVGTNWNLTTSGFHPVSAVGLTYFSFTRQVPAISLPSIGFPAPGCTVNIGLAAIVTSLTGLVTPNFTTTITIGIPAGPSFVGVPLNAQSIGFTPNNAAGFATSNGIGGVLGN